MLMDVSGGSFDFDMFGIESSRGREPIGERGVARSHGCECLIWQ